MKKLMNIDKRNISHKKILYPRENKIEITNLSSRNIGLDLCVNGKGAKMNRS